MKNRHERRKALYGYLAIAGCFLVAILLLKVVEFCITDIGIDERFQLIINALLYNAVVVSWVILAMGLIHWLLSLLSCKASDIVAAIFFGLFLLSEVGLTLYAKHNGYLLGSELMARPLSETLMAIRGAMGIAIPILLTLALLGGFTALALWRARETENGERGTENGERRHSRFHRSYVVLVVVVVLALMSVFFKMSHLTTFGSYNYLIFNKSQFLVVDCIEYTKWKAKDSESFSSALEQSNGTAYSLSEQDLEELLATHPEWGHPLDPAYPLEREFVADTFLNNFFSSNGNRSRAMPNVVIVVVESMGHEYMGWGAMPFVDSLAASGLYWPNCMSTTTRSYGAIPAITGSVGGPKSFQFGTMPDHNTLVSLLKAESYNTRAYYGGDFTFDCIYEYLTAQGIDYLSPFFEDYIHSAENKDRYWWGAPDDFLFRHTIMNLNDEMKSTSLPYFAIVTTLSMHDELKLNDKKRQATFEQKAKALGKNLQGIPAALFTDDCIRDFFHNYSQRDDFKNTIFVITGDHSSGRQHGDLLSYHHVPLIIWSPMVKHPARFNHIVTHNDITPALYSLLTSHFGLPAQHTVHWLGDGLRPTKKSILVVDYNHEIMDVIHNNHYYRSESRFWPETVYSFDTTMVLEAVANPSEQLLNSMRRQLELMKNLYFYTYHTNHLTAHPLHRRNYEIGKVYKPESEITCVYPDGVPSEKGTSSLDIQPESYIPIIKGFNRLRVNVEADVAVNKSIDMIKYPDIRFHFTGTKGLVEEDKISKFFTTNSVSEAGNYHLSISKEFILEGTSAHKVRVELRSPKYDEDFEPGVIVTLSNVKVTTEYGN